MTRSRLILTLAIAAAVIAAVVLGTLLVPGVAMKTDNKVPSASVAIPLEPAKPRSPSSALPTPTDTPAVIAVRSRPIDRPRVHRRPVPLVQQQPDDVTVTTINSW